MADPTRTNFGSGSSALASTAASFGFTATAGRLLVLTVASDDYDTGNPSGWTMSNEMGQETFLGSYVWWKVAAGGETSVTYVIGSASASAWTVTEFDNIDPTPYDGSEGQFQQSTADDYTTPTIVPTTGRRLLLAVMGGADTTNWGDVITWLNSFTEVNQSFQNTATTKDITAIAMRVVDGDGVTSFSSGATFTPNTPDAQTGHILSFKVAAGGAAAKKKMLAGLLAQRALRV